MSFLPIAVKLLPYLPDLKVLGRLCLLVERAYFDMSLDLQEQIVLQAEMVHILFVLQLQHGSAFVSGMLYHDLISMVQDNVITVVKLQVLGKDCAVSHEYFLCSQGSDALEKIFSILRTLSHNRGFCISAFADGVSTAHRLRELYEKYPEWHLEKRRLSAGTPSMDRDTKPRYWKGNVEVDKVNVQKAWAKGASNAVTIFQQSSKFKHIDLRWYRDQHLKGATLLQPKAGV